MSTYKKWVISLMSLGVVVLCMVGLKLLVSVEVFTSIFGFLGGWQLGSWAHTLTVKVWPELE